MIFLFFRGQRLQTRIFGGEKELPDKTKFFEFDNIQIDENMYFNDFPILFVHFSTLTVGILGYARAGVKIRNLSL